MDERQEISQRKVDGLQPMETIQKVRVMSKHLIYEMVSASDTEKG